MKLKLDEHGAAVVQDGKPVYVHDDGKEIAFDAPAAITTINARGAEAKEHRERATALAEQLKHFEGLEPGAARKAVETLANIDQKKLVDGGQVEQLKAAIHADWQKKFDAETARSTQLEQQLFGEIVGGAFARSTYIAEKLVLPPKYAQKAFGEHFKVEGGQLVAYDSSGKTLMSRLRPGETPSFDEAIELLVEMDPQRDFLLRATQRPGSGAPANGGGQGGAKTTTRAQFDVMTHAQRMDFSKAGGKVVE